MPRKQSQITADRIVCNQLFTNTISGSTVTETPAVGTKVLAQSDSGKTFFNIAGAVNYTVPAIADLTTGWTVTFVCIAANWTGVVTPATADVIFGSTIAAGLVNLASANDTITGSADVEIGDWFSLTFDGTNYNVTGIGATTNYITFAG
jgi:hypothetical protein